MPEIFNYSLDLIIDEPRTSKRPGGLRLNPKLKWDIVGRGSQTVVAKFNNEKCFGFDFGNTYLYHPFRGHLDYYHQAIMNILYPEHFPAFSLGFSKMIKDDLTHPGGTMRQFIKVDPQATEELWNKNSYYDDNMLGWGFVLTPELEQKQKSWLKAGIPLNMDTAVIKNFWIDDQGKLTYLDVLTDDLEQNPSRYRLDLLFRDEVANKWWDIESIADFIESFSIDNDTKDRVIRLSKRAKHLRILRFTSESRFTKGNFQEKFDKACQILGLEPYQLTNQDLILLNGNKPTLRMF